MASNDLVWEEGDIAFLRGVAELNDGERRALAGYVPPKATGHPVIVLEHTPGSKYCTITTVSAYGSGSHNRFLAPWDQPAHKRKSRGAFFAFAGSEKPADWQEHLELEDNGCWPKPKTSWVYSRNVFVVPCSTLREFRRGTRLRMTRESLKYLLAAMAKTSSFANRWNDTRLPQDARACAPAGAAASHLDNWWPLSNNLKLDRTVSFHHKPSAGHRTRASHWRPGERPSPNRGDCLCLRRSLGPPRLGPVSSRSQGSSIAGTATGEDKTGRRGPRYREGWFWERR
ncbi:hypothetical protein F4820DRAFT_449309 [Hypoxylon rubiginosum]|uniref:Uncharacterized protein n=1 Tax=Hypoxylon rubiginosum TaxID=110542 RepID=A0ACB9YYK6_9PEZI|nr:hypothetical protein F4820DRAFT_449309 [Hypoxylon rubiginosum]